MMQMSEDGWGASPEAGRSDLAEGVAAPAGAWDAAPRDPGGERPDGQDAAALALPARPSAEEVRQALLPLIADEAGEGALAIDAAEVERLPIPVIQVLLAAIRELEAAGRTLTVRNPSFAFGLAFEALGYSGEREIFTVEYS